MTGKLKDLTINLDGTQNITVTVQADFREAFDELFDKELDIEIKKHYKSRTLDASAKAWVMIDQLAQKTRMTKTEVYRHAIKEIGGVSDVICVRDFAVKTLCDNWTRKGQGWMAETSPSKLPGCTNVTLWYGSSCYDSRQMSDLISELIQECNEQGIPTMSDNEAEKLLGAWAVKKEKENGKVDTPA